MDRRQLLQGLAGGAAHALVPSSSAVEREGVSVWYWCEPFSAWVRDFMVNGKRRRSLAHVDRWWCADTADNQWVYTLWPESSHPEVVGKPLALDVWGAMDAADACLRKHGIDLSNPIVFGSRKLLQPGSLWKHEIPTAYYPENFYGEGVEVVRVSPCYRTIQFAVPEREFGSIHTVSTDGFLAAFRFLHQKGQLSTDETLRNVFKLG